MAAKRKRLSLKEKATIIEEFRRNPKKSKVNLAKQFQIPESTLKGIINCQNVIMENVQKCGIASNKRMRIHNSKTEEFDKALIKWFNEASASNVLVSGVLLKKKAIALAVEFGLENFQASCGWLDKFKKRHGFFHRIISGESTCVEEATVDIDACKKILPVLVEGYAAKDIFNADETGLFFNLHPDKTITYKQEKCHRGKRSKERVTVLFCTNSDGSEKLPPLVIGKYEKPRCFKNITNKPCPYTHSAKALMNSEIFVDWLYRLDDKMGCTNRNIILFIDQCPAHPADVPPLKNVRVLFFPPNCASALQPMELGVIRYVKAHYRKSLIRKLLINVEQNQPPRKMNILEAMHMICLAWEQISPSVLLSCFRAGGFCGDVGPAVGETEETNDITEEEWRGIANNSQVTIEDFINCDEGLLVAESKDSEEISLGNKETEEISIGKKETEEISVENKETEEENDCESLPSAPSFKEAMNAVEVLRRYAIFGNVDADMYSLTEEIERRVMRSRFQRK